VLKEVTSSESQIVLSSMRSYTVVGCWVPPGARWTPANLPQAMLAPR